MRHQAKTGAVGRLLPPPDKGRPEGTPRLLFVPKPLRPSNNFWGESQSVDAPAERRETGMGRTQAIAGFESPPPHHFLGK